MLVLASASPRRAELLTQAGLSFTIHPANVPEQRRPSEDPTTFAQRLAHEKAEAVSTILPSDPNLLVLGADTIVIAPDGSVLGKPSDPEDAARMLHLLAGATHRVITGICLHSAARIEVASELTYVTFHTLSESDITAYIATGEPFGKAGAYAIQGYAARWVPRIHGCYFNVVGLPLALVFTMLQASGYTCQV